MCSEYVLLSIARNYSLLIVLSSAKKAGCVDTRLVPWTVKSSGFCLLFYARASRLCCLLPRWG
jgi:hypothetical protein